MRQILEDPLLERLSVYVQTELSTDPGHDYTHALRVALWGIIIGEDQIDAQELIAAALLHDIINPPKDSPLRSQASSLSADKAHAVLMDFDFNPLGITRICNAIRDHSYSRGAIPVEPLGKVLQDADRLEALGAVGIMRCVSTGVQLGGALFNALDPWADDRDLEDKRYALDHFFTKLLKLPQTMQTSGGRAEAKRRAQVMNNFLLALGEELGHPYKRLKSLSFDA